MLASNEIFFTNPSHSAIIKTVEYHITCSMQVALAKPVVVLLQQYELGDCILVRKSNKKQKKRRKVRRTLVKLLLLVLLLWVMVYLYNIVPAWLYPVEYSEVIVEEANKHDIDPLLVCAIIKSESNYDAQAESAVGAVGLMQLMPDTASWLAGKYGIEYEKEMLYDAEYNISLGCLYLSTLLDYWDGNVVEAVASYNGGHGNVDDWISSGTWNGTEEDIANIPFAETRTYTQKVMSCYDNYINLYGDDVRFAGFR